MKKNKGIIPCLLLGTLGLIVYVTPILTAPTNDRALSYMNSNAGKWALTLMCLGFGAAVLLWRSYSASNTRKN